MWTYFIPLKWELYLINLEPPSVRIKFQTPLRYSSYLRLSDLFDVKVEIKMQYRIDENRIPILLKSLNREIIRLNKHIHEKVSMLLQSKYLDYYRSSKDIPLLKARFSRYIQNQSAKNSLYSDCQKIFDPIGIEILRSDLIKVYVPDADLYQAQIADLESIVQARKKTLLKNVDREAEVFALREKNKLELQKASEVLKLIRDDPRILEYFKYQNLNPKTTVIRIETEKDRPILHDKKDLDHSDDPPQSKTERPENKSPSLDDEEPHPLSR